MRVEKCRVEESGIVVAYFGESPLRSHNLWAMFYWGRVTV